ncbi:hypothetical protein EGH82_13465 [Vibrio ponticus]|uniref:Uncharacterized protein n=1 Tax=Vibrio ponticus TaxID=265668 RepID=A0A3N3DYC0_9VIBR|nr:hypothetical protein [Vibrio ponticus]ROV59503.1 hypothetical protein EGH82_13465 [Vibrio ponticus]
MIGFVSAISSALAVIVLVVIATLIAFVQAIMPETGLVKINDEKYRYVMESSYVDANLIREVIMQSEVIDIDQRVISYQNGCNYGFNSTQRQMEEIGTFNYIKMTQYFADSVPVAPMFTIEESEMFNTCFIDINLSPLVSETIQETDNE